jgi:hypothetical protein
MNTTKFECQVWDSVTGEWSWITVDVPSRVADTSEPVAAQAQMINEAVSVQMDEERGAWVLTDSHVLWAVGNEVLLIQLRALTSDDISVIMAVRA